MLDGRRHSGEATEGVTGGAAVEAPKAADMPAFVGLTATLRIELAAPTTAADVQAALARHPALQLGEAPTLADAIGEDVIHVGPPTLRGQVLHLWLAADDTRVGAALLAVRILEGLEASR